MKWEMVKIKSICDIVRGSSPRPKGDPRYYGGDFPRLMIEDITRDGKYVTPRVDSLTKEGAMLSRPMKKGDLVITVSGRTGIPAILSTDACIHDGFVGFKNLSKEVDVEYLYIYLFHLSSETDSKSVGAIFKNLTTDQIKEISIPLPPLPIQRAIAERLDRADALRQKDRELLLAYDDLAQSVFVEMFGDPVKNEKGWEVRKLEHCCDKITDGTHFSPPSYSEGIPYITAKHVKETGLDFFSNPTYVALKDHLEIYPRCNPEKGDILYIKDGATTGIASINFYEFEFSMLSSLALLKPNKGLVNSYFLRNWLNQPGVKASYLQENMSGAAIKRFTLQKIKKFNMLLPPLPLQNRFATILKNIEQQKELVRKQIAESEALFGRLLQEAFG